MPLSCPGHAGRAGWSIVRASLLLLLLSIAIGTAAVLALRPSEPEVGAADVAPVATGWVGVGEAQPPRRDGEEWEIDVAVPTARSWR